jgi:uncharacterized protein (TIGR03546 family)
MIIKWIAKLIVAFNSNISKAQIAAGFACGLLLALVPAGNLLWIALFLAVFLTKANYGVAMIAMAILKLFTPIMTGPIDALGWAILNAQPLEKIFTDLYALPIAPLTRFNNTLVMGGFAAGLALWLPAFFSGIVLVAFYRKKLAPTIANSKPMKAFLKLPLISSIAGMVVKLSGMAGA